MLRLILGILLLRATAAAYGQGLMLRQINEDSGLPSNCVLDLYVDGDGLLWVSTNKGLYRYDGFRYERIGEGTGLAEVNIVTIKELPELDLTILVAYGRRIFAHRHDSIWEIPITGHMVADEDHGAFTGLVLDEHQRLHVGLTTGTGHFVIDLRSGWIEEAEQPRRGYSGHLELINGHPLAWAAAKPFRSPARDTIALNSFTGTVQAEPRCHASSMLSDTLSDDGYWMAHCQELFVFDKTGVRHMHLPGRLIGLTEDGSGRLWARMWDTGVRCYDRALNELPFRDSRLERTQVTACVQDRQGGLWFGTIDRGLFYCADPDVRYYSSRGSLGAPWVSTLTGLADGTVYCGTGNGQLFRFGPDGSPKLLLDARQLAGSAEIKRVIAMPDHVLLPGRLDRGWSIKNDRPLHYPERDALWRNAYALAHLDGTTYLFAHIMGVEHIDLGERPRIIERLFDARTYAIVPDRGGDGHFLATHNGLVQLSHVGGKRWLARHVGSPTRTYDAAWADDRLWLATQHGLSFLSGDSTTGVPLSDAPTQPVVRALAIQDQRWLWIATFDGLYRKDLDAPMDRVPQRFGRARGLTSEALTDVTLAGDRLWAICGPDVVSIPLASMQRTLPDAPLSVLGVLGDGREGTGSEPRFPPGTEQITVILRNHDYLRHTAMPFRYRIQPDATWSHTATPEIQLVGLEPGDYGLEVSSVNASGQWSTPVFARWVIITPYWDTVWFKGMLWLMGVAVALALVLYVRERKHREALLAARAERYHHKALLAQMEPHFLYNALNSIQGFVATNNGEAAIRYIAKFAKLMRGLLHTAHNEQVRLAEEIGMLDNYCALEALRGRPPFSYHIVVEEGLDPERTYLPSFMVQPYVENAIRHGLRGLSGERPGTLSILFALEKNGQVCCTITDNGVGRDQARATTGPGSGWRALGTTINMERSHLLARMGTPVKVSTEDLRDATGRPLGTRVQVRTTHKPMADEANEPFYLKR